MDSRTRSFALFGMGPLRRKLHYAAGMLSDALTAEILHRWTVYDERIEPAEHRVSLDTADGPVRIVEDDEGVFLEARGDRIALTCGPVRLERFAGHRHAAMLRALHAELLVNVMPWGPVPNLWVYPRPWYRDAAMVMMCLERTGNLALLEPWVQGLHQVFDRNNAGEAEADNLGQVLYMVSRVSDRRHPLVERTLKAVEPLRRGRHIVGRSDFAEHAVYQTKWLKLGLRGLGMDDPYEVPAQPDSYSALFWMDFHDQHVPTDGFDGRTCCLYPYLAWAEAHFHNAPPPGPMDVPAGPLTWEASASQADYWRLEVLHPALARQRIARPHTWHAAEMFLYLLDRA